MNRPSYQAEAPARHWLPRAFDAGDVGQVVPLLDELVARELPDLAAVERWIVDRSELEAALTEHTDLRHVESTRHTDDPAVQQAFLELLRTLWPAVLEKLNVLERRLLALPQAEDLEPSRREWLEAVRDDVELFRDENVVRLLHDEALRTRYAQVTGAMTAQFDGQELTLQQLAKVLEQPDRARREAAFRATWGRVAADRGVLESLFDELVSLRWDVADAAGCRDYREYAFRSKHRRYSPDDCLRLHDAIEDVVLPLARRLEDRRRERMGLDRLRPWDLSVDVDGPPLTPFETEEQLVAGVETVIEAVDPSLAARFRFLRSRELVDLMSRPGKAPGAYSSTLQDRRLPFVFMSAAGRQADVKTLLHELGHAFHALECRDHDLVFNRRAPLEFAEVASMSMELLGGDRMASFLGEEAARRAKRTHLAGIVDLFPWVATIDSFQHAVYSGARPEAESRQAAWLSSYRRFRGGADLSGLEDFEAMRWLRQQHLFTSPFYYVEYALAQLGALQVWRNWRLDPAGGLAAYRAALALGGTRPLHELFAAAGARLDFGPQLLRELMDFVGEELERLDS